MVTGPGPAPEAAESESPADGLRAVGEQLSEACLTGPMLEEEEQTPAATEIMVDDLIRAFYLVDDRATAQDAVREALELLDRGCASSATVRRLAVATGVEGDESPPGGAGEPFDCDAQGINVDEGEEGTCVAADGRRVTVADRGSTATTSGMEVTLEDVEIRRSLGREGEDGRASRRAGGVFVLLTLRVGNRLEEPVEFDPGRQVELEVGGDRYFSDAVGTTAIEPDEERTGTVTFDIPENTVEDLDTNGNVFVMPFEEAGGPGGDEAATAVLRTYE
ncbi:MAG: DUF4352 domain-containing protein [Solirubrobacteraceae bacterium MAG38_C4-C5]|nr:DUF4352 domain-containing protein [Candidatus Siliceabacter maunaloa]